MKRRTFIKNSSLSISALPLLSVTQIRKPYNIVLIGSGWWGMNILREAVAYGNCRVVGLCDVDQNHLNAAGEQVSQWNRDKPKIFKDYRECIQSCKPDITIIGTPDHWHALPAIAAINIGSHVYLEKPIGHTIGEGQAILKAARTHNRMVQVGTHRRVSPHNISAMEFLRAGKAGKISQVKAFVNYNQGPGKKSEITEPPAHLDWDLFVGPAEETDYHAGIHPKGFRNYLNFANGTIGDWGIHWFDQVLWWTEEKFPKSIFSSGGRYVKEDSADAPDTQMAIFDFESFSMTWEHKLCAANANTKHNVGCYFYGTEGTFHLGWRDGWTFYPSNKNHEVVHQKPTLHKPDDQNIKELWRDFIDSIESNRLPVCDIKKGHEATNMSLLAMISYHLGRSISWDGEKENILEDSEASAMMTRAYRGPWEYPT